MLLLEQSCTVDVISPSSSAQLSHLHDHAVFHPDVLSDGEEFRIANGTIESPEPSEDHGARATRGHSFH